MVKFNSFLALILLCACSFNVAGTTRNSVGLGGDWNTNTNWSPASAPACNQTTSTDDIKINNDHKITLGGVLIVSSGTILEITTGDTLVVNGDVTFKNGSVVILNTGGVFIINGNVDNKNNSNQISISGLLSITGNYTGGNGSAVIGTGVMNITGTVDVAGSGNVFGSTMDCTTPGACNSSFIAPLPIKLLNFEALLNDNKIDLKWATSTEINNDYFTIEKSSDLTNWEVVSNVNGAGNSSTNIEYFEVDYFPYLGISFYRLKQTDFDGVYSYSKIISVKVESKLTQGINLFPNPVWRGSELKMQFSEITNAKVLIIIRDLNGHEFYSKAILKYENNALIAVPIDNEIPSGVYLVTASSESQLYNQKLLVK